jgi:hypothetical protein
MEVIKTLTDQGLHLKLIGPFSEQTDLRAVSLHGFSKIEVNLGEVLAINSIGMRTWLKWFATADPSAEIHLFECQKVIIDQITLIHGFLPKNAQIHSFYVPYYCEESDEQISILYQLGRDFSAGQVTAPTLIKQEDGRVFTLDVIPNKFFRFISG